MEGQSRSLKVMEVTIKIFPDNRLTLVVVIIGWGNGFRIIMKSLSLILTFNCGLLGLKLNWIRLGLDKNT